MSRCIHPSDQLPKGGSLGAHLPSSTPEAHSDKNEQGLC